VWLAVFAGAVGGAASLALIPVLHAQVGRPVSARAVALFIGLCVVGFVSRIAVATLLTRLSQQALIDLRLQLSRRILATPLRRLEEIGPARLLAILSEDVLTLSNVILGVPPTCINVAVLTCGVVYLIWLSWRLFLLVAVVAVVGTISHGALTRMSLNFMRQAREKQDRLFQHLRALTDGVKELQLNRARRRRFLVESLEATAGELGELNVAAIRRHSTAASWGTTLLMGLLGVVVFAWPQLRALEPAVQSGYILTLVFLLQPLGSVLEWIPIIGRARIVLGKIDSMQLRLESPLEPPSASPPTLRRGIELRQVRHSYRREDDEFVLGPLDVTLSPGELVFVVGGNGSGKTTFAKILLGLYAPEGGAVYVDGEAVVDAARDEYRQLFAAVFSDFHLFDRLEPGASADVDQRARAYLAKLRLDHKLRIEEGTFSTTELSQGQRKRLALLSAYLEDRAVYVFDEWAADQDPHFKQFFYAVLLPELKARGKAVLVISHDDRYFSAADRVLRLEDGQLVGDVDAARSIAAE
jgi:putative ATP-binding cassette transporter